MGKILFLWPFSITWWYHHHFFAGENTSFFRSTLRRLGQHLAKDLFGHPWLAPRAQPPEPRPGEASQNKNHQKWVVYGKHMETSSAASNLWENQENQMMNTWWFDGNLILILLGYGCLMILMAVHPRNRVCGLVHSRSCRVSRCK